MKPSSEAPLPFSLKDMTAIFSHAVVSSVSEPFHIIDDQYRILWISRREKIPRVIGKICHEIFQHRTSPCPDCPVSRVFRTGRSCVMEKWIHLPDNTRRRGEIRTYPVLDESNRIVYVLKIGYDITVKEKDLALQKRYVANLEKTLRNISGQTTLPVSGHGNNGVKVDLTPREFEVLRLLSQGFPNTGIAKILEISPHTVKTHVISIFNKLGINDRIQAAVWATRLGLV
jgi:DNA-binding CsgD family transcriptional regulator